MNVWCPLPTPQGGSAGTHPSPGHKKLKKNLPPARNHLITWGYDQPQTFLLRFIYLACNLVHPMVFLRKKHHTLAKNASFPMKEVAQFSTKMLHYEPKR